MKDQAKAGEAATLKRKLVELERRWKAGMIAPHEALGLCCDAGQDPPAWALNATATLGPRLPFAEEQQKLDALQKRFKGGDGLALFETMELCWLHNWLMPEWIHGSFLSALNLFRTKSVSELGEAFSVIPQNKKSVTKLHARTRKVNALTGRSVAEVLRAPMFLELIGSEIVTNEEHAARLAQTQPDKIVAGKTGLSTATVRRIRAERGNKKKSGRPK